MIAGSVRGIRDYMNPSFSTFCQEMVLLTNEIGLDRLALHLDELSNLSLFL